MIRFHCLRPLALALAGLFVLSDAEPLQAKKKGPTNQRFQGSIYVPFPIPLPSPVYPGEFEIRPWTDKVAPLGFVSGYFTVDTAGAGHRTGRIVLQNPNGDSVFIIYESQFTAGVNDPNFYGTFTIVGGSGKFANATGGGPFRHQQWMAPPGGGNPYIPVWFDGRITY
jgi:hypothetical protein